MNPTGGPKDSLPPVIINMTPENFKTNFSDKDKKIYIEFNEYVQLKDQQKEFFTSPQMKKKPALSIRGRGVAIQIKDTLKENTTYALNFGSALCDNNEGNPLYSMRYVFSTGATIDSMVMSGYTADSYKADSVSKSFVYFFPADSVENDTPYDSVMFKHKPAVIARAENNGIFLAQNLKPIPYRVYAVKDKNDNQMYEPSVDQIGFLEGTFNPAELPEFNIWYDSIRHYVVADPQLYFRMFTDVSFKRQALQQAERPQQHKAMLYFGAAHPKIEKIEFDSVPAENIIIEPLTLGRDTLALWFTSPSAELPDTIRGKVTYMKHDSLSVLQRVTEPLKLSWRFIESKEQQKEREKLERAKAKAEAAGETWVPPYKKSEFAYKLPTSGDINPERHLSLSTDYPLAKIDSAVMLMTVEDDKKQMSDLRVHIVRDTADIHLWQIRSDWSKAGNYTLTIPKGALTDIAGFTNDSIVGKYTILDPEKCAKVILHLKDKGDGSKYIVQLLDGSGKLLEEKVGLTSGDTQFNYIPVGDIKFRIIEDRNDNGRWDTGNLVERREPERAEVYVNDKGEEIFAAKANWEIELAMDMNQIFAPVTMQSIIDLLEIRETQRLEREAEKRTKEGKKKKNQDNNTNTNQNGNGFNMGGMGGMGGMFNGSSTTR